VPTGPADDDAFIRPGVVRACYRRTSTCPFDEVIRRSLRWAACTGGFDQQFRQPLMSVLLTIALVRAARDRLQSADSVEKHFVRMKNTATTVRPTAIRR
jgi:hypothetical protein